MPLPCRCLVLLVILSATAARADPIQAIRLLANDLAYDPVTQRIYASVAGVGYRDPPDSLGLVRIDPETGQLESSVSVEGSPGKLAIAGQGRYLYVALDGGARVLRYDTVNRATQKRATGSLAAYRSAFR
jgi:DNA-binding beta-propeller fold protein YncE